MCNLFGKIGGDSDLSERGKEVSVRVVSRGTVMLYCAAVC